MEGFSFHILEEAATVEADHDATELDNYWTPWWQKKGAEQVPLELTVEQVLSAKKVEMENIEERGVCEVVKREAMEQTPGATMLSVKWVLTNKGTPKAPVTRQYHVCTTSLSPLSTFCAGSLSSWNRRPSSPPLSSAC